MVGMMRSASPHSASEREQKNDAASMSCFFDEDAMEYATVVLPVPAGPLIQSAAPVGRAIHWWSPSSKSTILHNGSPTGPQIQIADTPWCDLTRHLIHAPLHLEQRQRCITSSGLRDSPLLRRPVYAAHFLRRPVQISARGRMV